MTDDIATTAFFHLEQLNGKTIFVCYHRMGVHVAGEDKNTLIASSLER